MRKGVVSVLGPVVLVFSSVMLAACGGGESAGASPIADGHLVVRTVRDDAELTPLSGVEVILHGPDGRSIERVVTTGAAGRAEFGDVHRERVTVTTVADPLRWTLADVSPGVYVVRVAPAQPGSQPSYEPCDGYREISVTSETNDGEYMRIYPRHGNAVLDDESVEYPNYVVCSDQEDAQGHVSIMIGDALDVVDFGGGNYGEINAEGQLYGFSSNLKPAAGDFVVLNRDKPYVSHQWTSSEDTDGITVSGYDRSGRYFDLGGGPSDASKQAGAALLADQVELPLYRMLGGTSVGEPVESDTHDSFLSRGSYASQLLESLPETPHLETPALVISDVQHDQGSNELQLSGNLTSAGSMVRVVAELYDGPNYSNFRRWILYFPSTRSTLPIPTIPTIPAEVSSSDFESQNWVEEGTVFYVAVLDEDAKTYDDAVVLRYREEKLSDIRSYRYSDYWRENYYPVE